MALKSYKEMQKVSRLLSEKIPEIYGIECFPKIARLLGIKHGRDILIESEEEINFIIDFYLNEYDHQGRTYYEQYRKDYPNIDERQIAYIDAAQKSYTSFFEILECDGLKGIMTVKNLLNPSDTVEVTNQKLSLTGKLGSVVFSRFLSFETFNSFSGMYAIFPGDFNIVKRQKIMKRRVKSEKDSVKRFVAAFKLNRTFGIDIRTD